MATNYFLIDNYYNLQGNGFIPFSVGFFLKIHPAFIKDNNVLYYL